MKKTYLLSVRFKDMGPDDSVFLTEGGQPFEVREDHLPTYAGYLRQGEGFLGDLFEVYGDKWNVEQVFAHELRAKVEVTEEFGG